MIGPPFCCCGARCEAPFDCAMKVSFAGTGFRHNEFQSAVLTFRQGSLRAERRACHTGAPNDRVIVRVGHGFAGVSRTSLAADDRRQCCGVLGVLLHKITLPPYVPYIHLLVDYHFGFIKRALIGATVSLFFAKIPVWLVFALGGAVWLVTLGLFVALFRRTFGLDDRQMPLFVFMAGSPFFFKNFMHTLGHFDIYGCALAIVLLLVPARSIVFRGGCRAGIDDPDFDPPDPFSDVCADHRRDRRAPLLPCSRRQPAKHDCRDCWPARVWACCF